MDKNISLRNAEVGDIQPIKEILYCSLDEYNISIPDNYSVSDIDSIEFENNYNQVFVILRDISVIGFMVLRPMTKDCLELKRLYLTASERGQGFGTFLLDYAVKFARKNHYRSIRLETTSKFKEAVSLYKKSGFVILDGVKKAPGHDLVFQKKLFSYRDRE
jgi:GNAT superfamily N-acetyltransferase